MTKEFSILFIIILFAFYNPSLEIPLNSTQQVGNISVSGHYEYWDYTGASRSTVWSRVWIFDVDPGGYQRLANVNGINEWFTDINGNFSSGAIRNSDPEDGGGLDIAVFIFAWNLAAEVINSTGNIYGFGIGTWSNVPDGMNIGFSVQGVPADQIGAWMIFSYHSGISAGWNYLNSSVNYEMPMATVVWPFNTNNPFYDSTNEIIFLPNWAVHPDITLHEYAHYIMNITYGYMPPALPQHSINETSNLNTAWVEGWADFFPLIVQNDPVLAGWNLEAQHWCSPDWDDGDLVEGRVAGALWDIFDSQNDSAPWYYDSFSNGFTNIWNIMRTTPCDTFHEFWQAWNTSSYPKQPALLAIFQNSIDYRGLGDTDANGYVDIMDVRYVADRFGMLKGDDQWDDRADWDHNDKINIFDVRYSAKNFGKSYDC